MNRIYVRQAIEAGIKDSDQGRTLDVKEVRNFGDVLKFQSLLLSTDFPIRFRIMALTPWTFVFLRGLSSPSRRQNR
jgi:hypothetical protein